MRNSRAMRVIKILCIILFSIALLIGLELGREWFVYRRISSRIESAHAQLKIGMTKQEVREIAGEPKEITQRRPDEYWMWTARESEGALWRRLGFSNVKGHYDLIVRFDADSRITKIFGGVN